MKSYFTIFETDLGWMGIAWQSKQIRETQLPQRNKDILSFSMEREHQGKKAPLWVEKIIQKMQRHLQGSEEDFQNLPYFWDKVTDFQRKVYQGALQIPYGKVVSYKGLAEQIGKPKAARAVGQALSKNPFPLIVPCHRILASGNRPGGFTAYGGLNTKEKLLQIEGYSWGKSPRKKS